MDDFRLYIYDPETEIKAFRTCFLCTWLFSYALTRIFVQLYLNLSRLPLFYRNFRDPGWTELGAPPIAVAREVYDWMWAYSGPINRTLDIY